MVEFRTPSCCPGPCPSMGAVGPPPQFSPPKALMERHSWTAPFELPIAAPLLNCWRGQGGWHTPTVFTPRVTTPWQVSGHRAGNAEFTLCSPSPFPARRADAGGQRHGGEPGAQARNRHVISMREQMMASMVHWRNIVPRPVPPAVQTPEEPPSQPPAPAPSPAPAPEGQ